MTDVDRNGVGERFRRSSTLTLHWEGAGLQATNWLTHSVAPLPALCVPMLAALTEWRSAPEVLARCPELDSLESTTQLLTLLADASLLDRASEPRRDLSVWAPWSPAAAAFHFATKGGSYPDDLVAYEEVLRAKAVVEPPPPACKKIAGNRTRLASTDAASPITTTLQQRRTWRNFGTGGLQREALEGLLFHTWGVQAWGHVPGQGRIPLKTSPSGGARHAIEAYVAVLDVAGLEPGWYHYDAEANELVGVRNGCQPDDLVHCLAGQDYFRGAAAAIFMCPVFARAMWRYPFSRAYRAVLIEAGHLGQSFCLLATEMGLAPFSTMAFRETEIETILGLDGVAECPIYVVGVGSQAADRRQHPGEISG
ncbi:MAG: SagB family peptide dehydrogenase [Acidobacteriota bacterium]|nr:SagB family peptide dehydrogenase [Acidobacteriota bacterium]